MRWISFLAGAVSVNLLDEKVSEAQIKLLEAAMVMPTAMNMQPWHFVVIDDPEILVKLRGALPREDGSPAGNQRG